LVPLRSDALKKIAPPAAPSREIVSAPQNDYTGSESNLRSQESPIKSLKGVYYFGGFLQTLARS
jgi:hypothetical protein